MSELTKDGTVFSHSGKEPLRFLKNSGMTRRSRLVGDVQTRSRAVLLWALLPGFSVFASAVICTPLERDAPRTQASPQHALILCELVTRFPSQGPHCYDGRRHGAKPRRRENWTRVPRNREPTFVIVRKWTNTSCFAIVATNKRTASLRDSHSRGVLLLRILPERRNTSPARSDSRRERRIPGVHEP